MSYTFARPMGQIDDRAAISLTRQYQLGATTPTPATDEATSSAPTFDMKRDIIAGAVAFAAPLAYSKWSDKHKKWPKLGLFTSIVAVIGVYFGTVMVYEKLKTI